MESHPTVTLYLRCPSCAKTGRAVVTLDRCTGKVIGVPAVPEDFQLLRSAPNVADLKFGCSSCKVPAIAAERG